MPASFSSLIISSISWRSIGPPQAVVTGTVGDGLLAKPQPFGRRDVERRRRLALAGQDVEHDVAADRAAGERLGAGSLDRLDSVARHRGEDADHLAVAVG